MTSQAWLTDADFSADSQAKSIWWHYLVVIVPDEVNLLNISPLLFYLSVHFSGQMDPQRVSVDHWR
jgi:hypothetical protein